MPNSTERSVVKTNPKYLKLSTIFKAFSLQVKLIFSFRISFVFLKTIITVLSEFKIKPRIVKSSVILSIKNCKDLMIDLIKPCRRHMLEYLFY